MTALGRKQEDWFDRRGGTYVRAKQAAKMPMLRTHTCAQECVRLVCDCAGQQLTYEKVLPNRRGVLWHTYTNTLAVEQDCKQRVVDHAHLMSTSDGHVSQFCFFMIAGR
jgi:hypothetical protein